MKKSVTWLAITGIMAGSAAFAGVANQPQLPASTPEQPKVCKKVVDATPGSKPYDLCLTRAAWEAKKLADAKDPNRMVCKYTESPVTRFRSYKICMTAMEWERQRQEDRAAIDHIQRQSCVPGGGC
jgi:hypothetical protein